MINACTPFIESFSFELHNFNNTMNCTHYRNQSHPVQLAKMSTPHQRDPKMSWRHCTTLWNTTFECQWSWHAKCQVLVRGPSLVHNLACLQYAANYYYWPTGLLQAFIVPLNQQQATSTIYQKRGLRCQGQDTVGTIESCQEPSGIQHDM